MADDWKNLAEHVRREREKRGWTQQDAVDRAKGGIQIATWRNIERGEQTSYRPMTLAAVARALGWTADDTDLILRGEDPFAGRHDPVAPGLDARLRVIEEAIQELQRAVGVRPGPPSAPGGPR